MSAALILPAHAGAWLAPEGHGQVVVTATASSAGKAFDGDGSLQGTPRYKKDGLSALMKRGYPAGPPRIPTRPRKLDPTARPPAPARSGSGNSGFAGRGRVPQQDSGVLRGRAPLRDPATGD